MLKKIGLPVVLLAGMLALAPRPAKAEVHFGVYVGTPAPVYPVYPAYPAYGYDAYADPYVYPAPVYRAPAYVAPYSYGYNYRSRDYDRRDWRDRDRHERHERHEGRGRR
jgi:hypothetical protein